MVIGNSMYKVCWVPLNLRRLKTNVTLKLLSCSVLLCERAVIVSVQEKVVHIDLPAFWTQISRLCCSIRIGLIETHVITPSSVENIDAILSRCWEVIIIHSRLEERKWKHDDEHQHDDLTCQRNPPLLRLMKSRTMTLRIYWEGTNLKLLWV